MAFILTFGRSNKFVTLGYTRMPKLTYLTNVTYLYGHATFPELLLRR